MTTKQVDSKEAIVESTDSAASEQIAPKKGDYTKYFYRNIDNLWYAVEQLQKENDQLHAKLSKVQVVFAEGA
jgi:hypothetical protein